MRLKTRASNGCPISWGRGPKTGRKKGCGATSALRHKSSPTRDLCDQPRVVRLGWKYEQSQRKGKENIHEQMGTSKMRKSYPHVNLSQHTHHIRHYATLVTAAVTGDLSDLISVTTRVVLFLFVESLTLIF